MAPSDDISPASIKPDLRLEPDPAWPWRDVEGTGFNAHIGPMRFARLSPTEFAAALLIGDQHINIGGVCHGGVLMSLADVAMGAGSFAAGDDHPCATISFDAQFLAAAKHGQWLIARSQQMRRVRELSFMACALSSGGRPVMRASGIWKYLASRGPGRA
ncbi:MAG: PaaI family thioesterase [Pseudomonadota bacterium]